MRGIFISPATAIAVWAVALSLALPSTAQTEKIVYNFQGAPDGSVPSAHLIRDSSGNLYGTSAWGGTSGYGTVFKIDTKGTETIIHNFTSGSDGANPEAALIRDAAGNLYGTTERGGIGNGTIFEIDTTGKETILHAFETASAGVNPLTALMRDASGNVYGTTSSGGLSTCLSLLSSAGCGTIFKLSTSGKMTVLHTFGSGTDGKSPAGDLISDSVGNFYGTTYDGGTHGYGTVFKLAKNGVYSSLYSFNFGVGPDGARPLGNLVRDSVGNLYGTTKYGGFFANTTCQGSGCGTIFKVDASGNETVLYAFVGNPDGYYPEAGLVIDASGNLFGTTARGGENGSTGDQGTVFRVAANGQETVLHSFGTGTDGFTPIASLTPATGGAYYGTASQGGTGEAGVVFKIVP
jgi:uncharacterized repeat protein (TIGR03803 family)